MANNPFNRAAAIAHNPDSVWNSTHQAIWNKVMPDNIFEGLTIEDLEGDNSIFLMTTFVNRVADNPPISSHTRAPYASGTLLGALNAVMHRLKQRFANQLRNMPEIFPESDATVWRKRIKHGRSRTMMEGDAEGDVFKSVFPLPVRHSHHTRLLPIHDFPSESLRNSSRTTADMHSICRKKFAKEKFAENLKMVLTYKAVARGGEVKFISWRRFYYDPYYNILFTQWFQKKTLKSTPSGFAVDYSSPYTCAVFNFACFFACCGGLVRGGAHDPGTAQDRINAYVFQDLHRMKDDAVATAIGNMVKDELSDELKKYYSVKSMRIGANTHLAWDPRVTRDEAVALGGWSSGSNSDWYLWYYLVAIIPPILSLAEYPDVRIIPYAPSCLRLQTEGEVENRWTDATQSQLILELFPNTLREFAPHGRMYKFLEICAAVMIMHFSEVYSFVGYQHQYTRAISNAVIRIGLAGNRDTAHLKLQGWSRIIKDDYRRETAAASFNADVGGPVQLPSQEAIATMRAEISRLAGSHAAMETSLELCGQRLVQAREDTQFLRIQNLQLLEQNRTILVSLDELSRKLRGSQPVVPPIHDNVPPPLPPADTPPPTETPRPASQSTRAPPPAAATTVTPATRSRPLSLQQARAQPQGKRKKGEQRPAESLIYILNELYTEPNSPLDGLAVRNDRLDTCATWIHDVIFNRSAKTRQKLETALNFWDAIWTSDERQQFINKRYPDQRSRANSLNAIGKRALQACYILNTTVEEFSRLEPNPAMKLAVQGFANNIQKTSVFKDGTLLNYVPDWQTNPPTRLSDITLHELAIKRTAEIKRKFNL